LAQLKPKSGEPAHAASGAVSGAGTSKGMKPLKAGWSEATNQ